MTPFQPWDNQLTPEVVGLALQHTPAGLAALDPQGRVLFANPSVERIVGRPEAELVGRPYERVFAEEEREQLRQRIADPRVPQRVRGHSRVCRPDGSLRDVEIMHFHMDLPARRVVLVVLLDVTEPARLAHKMATLAHFASSLAYAGSLEGTLASLTDKVVRTTEAVDCSVSLAGTACSSPSLAAIRTGGVVVERGEQTVVAVPLVFAGSTLGSLNAVYAADAVIGEAETTFLKTLADLAAVAVENARLFTEAEQKAALEERARLARELHDSVAQALYGIGLGARTAAARLASGDPSLAAEPLEYVLGLAQGAVKEMQALIFALRPDSVEREGLVEALRKQAESLRSRHGLEVTECLVEEPDLSAEQRHALYRVASEALHNVVKHSRAGRVSIRLESSPAVHLEIADDGRGFDPAQEFPGQLGLRSMEERVSRLGGQLSIDSAPGRGTRVDVLLS